MKAKPSCAVSLIFILACPLAYAQQKQVSMLDSINGLAEQANSTEAKIDVWYKAAETWQRSKPEVVLKISKAMIEHSLQAKYQMGQGLAYEQMGNAYYYLRKTDSSIWAYKNALEKFQLAHEPRKIFSTYNDLVLTFRLAGSTDSIRHYITKEIEQSRVTKDSSDIAMALHDDAYWQTEQNQLNKAITLFFEALKFARPGDYDTRININNGIGDSYRIMGNDSASLPFFLTSKEVAMNAPVTKLKKESMLAIACNRVSSAYLEMNKLVEAKLNIDEQLNHAIKSGDPEHRYRAMLNYGIYYSKTQNLDSAEFAYAQCLKIQKQVGRKRAVGIIHYNMAGLYNDFKKFSKALAHADSAHQIFTALKNSSWQTENFYTHSVALAGVGRYKEAFGKMDEYVITNHKLMTEDNNQKIAEMQAAYDVEKKDAAIAVLNKENELKNSQRNFFVAVAGSLLVMVLLALYLYRQKQKSNALLSEKNLVIEKSLHERESLLKEIHHRVKNNLQIISSLLSLQSKSLHDTDAQGAISESRNRVKSMALIHEQLYQEDTISGVEMKDYLQRLVNSLTSSYGLDTDRVEIKIVADNILLDVDSAIPLGLIINELVSNSMKYAFPEKKSGTILVSLHEMMSELKLIVQDNGVGMDVSKKSNQSFGLSMVNSLMRKLKAEMNIVSEAGTSVELVIRDFRKVAVG